MHQFVPDSTMAIVSEAGVDNSTKSRKGISVENEAISHRTSIGESARESFEKDSCYFSIHTSVQIPEISSFRRMEGDSPVSSATQEFPDQMFLQSKLGDNVAFSIRSSNDSLLPVFLKFEDIKFKVEYKQPQDWSPRKALVCASQDESSFKKILNGITGTVVPGEVLAIMGPSGSGKTSLLRILAGRLQRGVTGVALYNDIPYSGALKRRIGFVTQDDVLFPQLTVHETLIFAAQLRLPSSMNLQQKVKRANDVIIDLGLEKCQNTRVGGIFVPGLSGGERKRTSIAYELLVDPSLLFLDEPTSGLDSSTALRLIRVLQKNAKIGRTVVLTIHQPSSRIFHLFDKLILISEGHPVYSGKPKDAMHYFAALRFVPELAMNPADFLLDLATGFVADITVPEELRWDPDEVARSSGHSVEQNFSREVIKTLQKKYSTGLEPLERKRIQMLGMAPDHLQAEMQVRRDWTSSWVTQFVVLSKRTFRERARDYFEILRLLQAIGVAFLLGLLWWQSRIETEAQLRDQVGLLFYVCIFWSTSSIFASVYSFPLEHWFIAKERAADMYRLSAYHVSSSLCDTPAQLLYPALFMTILYFMAGFQRAVSSFLLTHLSLFLIVLTGQGVGELFGAAILNIKKAGTIVSLVLLLFLLTGGYYVQHIPFFIRWIKYLSFVYYGFRLLLKVQYSSKQTYECFERGGCKSLQTSPSFAGIIDLDGGAEEAWVLVAMALVYRVLAYVFLRRIKLGT